MKREKIMKKKLIKLIALLLLVLALMTLFTGCLRKCDACGKYGIAHKVTILGETCWLCDDCYKDYKSVFN